MDDEAGLQRYDLVEKWCQSEAILSKQMDPFWQFGIAFTI